MDAADGAPPRPEHRDGALGPYLRAIRTHRLLVATVTLVALVAAMTWHALRDDRYESTARILLSPLSSSDPTFSGVQLLRESNDPTRSAQTVAGLIESPRAAEATAREIGRGFSRQDIEAAIKVRPQGESNILSVTSQARDPALAARIANTYTDQSLAIRAAVLRRQLGPIIDRLNASGPDDQRRARTLQAVTSDPTLSISEPAIAADDPVGADWWLIALLAIAAGFIVGAAAALIMVQVDQRLHEEEDFVELYPLAVLARVPKSRTEMFRDGDLTQVPPAVREAYRTLAVQIEQLDRDPRIVMCTSGSEGDGKTSCAINLALALAGGGHRVLLMDLDVRTPDLTRIVGLSEAPGVLNALSTATGLADLMVPAPRIPPLSVLPAGSDPGQVLLLPALARRLPALMREARALADYVVVDTAALGVVSDALHIVAHVDEVLLVARPGTTQRPQLTLVRELLERVQVTPVGMVMTGAQA